jgi:flagellar basal body-associated protein FliL
MVFGHNPHFKAPEKKSSRIWIILVIIVALLLLGYYVIALSFGDK